MAIGHSFVSMRIAQSQFITNANMYCSKDFWPWLIFVVWCYHENHHSGYKSERGKVVYLRQVDTVNPTK